MKKISTLSFLLFIGFIGFAQLTVKPTSYANETTEDSKDFYIYVKGTVVSVEGNTELTKNNDTDIASIYLREKGQFVQKDESSPNSGTGLLSVYQEGTSDAYAYNYWGSPVGVLMGNETGAGNKSFGIQALEDPNTTLASFPANITGNYEGSTNPLTISRRWIYKFIGTGDDEYFSWIHVGANYGINPGEGFTMKGVNGTDSNVINGVQNNPGSNQRYDFRGRPNNGLIELTPATTEGEMMIVGNPYPSAINLNYFLIANSGNGTFDCGSETIQRRNATTGIAYFWDSDPSVQSHQVADYVGGYAAYSTGGDCNSSGVYTPPVFYNYTSAGEIIVGTGYEPQPEDEKEKRRFLPIAQGFRLDAPAGNIAPVQFSNAQRVFVKEGVDNDSYFDRTANSQTQTQEYAPNVVPKMRVNIEFNEAYTRQMAVAFSDNATTGYDVAMDAANTDELGSDAGSLINGSNYVIDIRPYDEEDAIPLFLNLTEQSDLSIKVNNFENFDTDNVFLYDTETDQYYSIKNDYFYITLPEGDYSGRFELRFQDDSSLSVEDEIADNFVVVQNNPAQQLEIYNPKFMDVQAVSVFDMTGKQILNKQNLGNNERFSFSTQNLAQAIYIVKITTKKNNILTKKITVFKGR